MSLPRYLCIHGHFYQPPRENPWLDMVEVQDSAAPDHDWNERITRECYGPNTRSRLLDDRGKIISLSNNYAWISFNFGPTLLSWMAEHAPEVLRGVVEADRLSLERRGGHGNALAQVYNHVIMPLASAHDKRTQVRWGVADFVHRFGRQPEGMWLAETAADVASLEALAAEGIRFTVLAPNQAKRWRRIGEEEWVEIPGGIDPSRAYTIALPSGRSLALFFYDGNVSRQVAFERLLDSGEKFYDRLMQGFDDGREHPQLMHIATDGESYGHHHAHGDMALAYVLHKLGRDPNVRLTNYGEFLELHPPEWEVEIHERSAWSCAHGVDRWNADCGCRTRGDWHQKWRGPLRRAFDQLKEQLDHLFATRGRECFPDPWAARDAYIDVILDRSPRSVRTLLRHHGHPDLDESQVRDALRLLEMQRDGMLMYTSCAWFFDELSGLETTQCLKYAARAIHLAKGFQRDFEGKFVQSLKLAPSNLPQFKHGRGVWDQLIRPAVVDLDRVLAHHAVSLIYPRREANGRVESFELDVLDQEVRGRGGSHLALGRLRVRSARTWEEAETAFVVIHYGGLDFHTVLRQPASTREYDGLKQRLLEAYKTGSMSDVTTLAAREFEGKVYRLDDLFVDEQRRIIGIVLQDRIEDYERTLERLAILDDDMLNRLGQMHYPIPRPLHEAASATLDRQLRQELAELSPYGSLARIQALYERGRTWGYRPERTMLEGTITHSLETILHQLAPDADLAALATHAGLLLDAAGLLGLYPAFWQVQNHLLDAYAQLADSDAMNSPLHEVFAELAAKLHINHDLLGWRP
jgi:alpha-amylase/alpha-mannosidase (GH57 family)